LKKQNYGLIKTMGYKINLISYQSIQTLKMLIVIFAYQTIGRKLQLNKL